MNPTFVYNAIVTRIHDGDTITAYIDLGFRVSYTTSIRLNGINAPEITGSERQLGLNSREHLKYLLAGPSIMPAGFPITLKTYKDPTDKYGRWLADVFLPDGTDVCKQMVTDGFAVAWDGDGPKPV